VNTFEFKDDVDPTTEDGAKVIIAICKESARELFVRYREVRPLFIFVCKPAGHDKYVVAMQNVPTYLFDSDEGKDAAIAGMRKCAKLNNAIAAASICEAWLATLSKEAMSNRPNTSLEFYPGRKEVVMLNFEHQLYAGTSTGYIAEISRDGDKAELGEWSPPAESSSGRFTGILSGEPAVAPLSVNN
jgi:hypothetical protein